MGKSGKPGKKKEEKQKGKQQKGKHRRQQLDSASLASFSKVLQQQGYELTEVSRDGNCFFRSLADQLENNQNAFEDFRQRICEHLESHEDDFSPFMSFGESEEEEDKDYASYVERMRTDGEWAGQVELIAAAQALRVNIVVHQLEHPSYRIECSAADSSNGGSKPKAKPPREIHISYHDGEHYNSVHSLSEPRAAARGTFAQAGAGYSGGDDESGGGGGGDADAPSVEVVTESLGGATLHHEDAAEDARGTSAAEREPTDEEAADARQPPSMIERARNERARKKEEKRLKKEQRHREATAAAREATDASKDGGSELSTSASERSIITL